MGRDKNQDKDGGGVIGWIITIIFALILAGGIYFLVNLFKSVEINEINLAGTWKLSGNPTEYLIINADNTLEYYQQYADGSILSDADYTYILETNEDRLTADTSVILKATNKRKHKDTFEMKITKLSNAEISILRNGKEFRNFTRVNIF